MCACRRAKLDTISLADVDKLVVSKDAARDMVMVLCILADWNPVCFKLENHLQAANFELKEEAAANSSSEAGHVRVFKLDASEGKVLQDRYHFRTVPMFLMFYEGRLVFASNNIRWVG